MPIKRAFSDYTSQDYDGFIGGSKAQVKSNKFPKYATLPHDARMYKRSDSPWVYSGIQSLDSINIAAVKNYKYGDAQLDKYLHNKENKNVLLVDEVNHLEKFLVLLNRKRIEAFAAGELPAQLYLRQNNVKNIVVASKSIGQFKNYISISPYSKYSKKLLDTLNKNFKKIHQNGTLKKIYQKYGIQKDIPLIE